MTDEMKQYKVRASTTYFVEAESEEDAVREAEELMWEDFKAVNDGRANLVDVFSFAAEEEKFKENDEEDRNHIC